MVVRSQTYYPKHILAYDSGKARYALVVGSGSFLDRLIRGGDGGGLSTTLAPFTRRQLDRLVLDRLEVSHGVTVALSAGTVFLSHTTRSYSVLSSFFRQANGKRSKNTVAAGCV